MTIAWGILGTGTAAVNFAEDLRRTSGAEVVAVGSRSAQSAQAFASRFAISHAHASWEDPDLRKSWLDVVKSDVGTRAGKRQAVSPRLLAAAPRPRPGRSQPKPRI